MSEKSVICTDCFSCYVQENSPNGSLDITTEIAKCAFERLSGTVERDGFVLYKSIVDFYIDQCQLNNVKKTKLSIFYKELAKFVQQSKYETIWQSNSIGKLVYDQSKTNPKAFAKLYSILIENI